MGNFQSIPYGNGHIEVTEAEYALWEDKVSQVPVSNDWYEWTTFDFLMANGYFCEKPKCSRPIANQAPARPTPSIPHNPVHEPLAVEAPELPVWEPSWTQSKVMAERTKLLNEREKALDKREKDIKNSESKREQQVSASLGRQRELENEVGTLRQEISELKELMGRAAEVMRRQRVEAGQIPVSEMSADEYRTAVGRRVKGFLKRAAWVAVVIGLMLLSLVWGLIFNPRMTVPQPQAQTAQQR